jgi:hypothetical protein
VEVFFFFLLANAWLLASLRLYFAALADCTAARGEDVWNGRRKDGGARALGVVAARKKVVGEAWVRHEGQYRCAAIIVGVAVSVDCTRANTAIYSHFHVRPYQNVEGSRSGGELGPG